MKILIVDDEQIAVRNMEAKLERIEKVKDVYSFTSPRKALGFLTENTIDVVLLDINMGQMNGLEFAKKLKELQPDCACIFVTGYSEYAIEAFSMKVSGYLLKPVQLEDIKRELDYVENRKEGGHLHTGTKIRVQCFGNFEVFAGEKPLTFSRNKTKELFAYLVDRKGAGVSNGEISAILWEDKPDSLAVHSMTRSIISDLRKSLSETGAEDILVRKRNNTAILTEKIDCDFYEYLKGNVDMVNQYRGEYMSQYSWAEMTLSTLS